MSQILLQPANAMITLPSSDRVTELYPGTDLGTQDAKERG